MRATPACISTPALETRRISWNGARMSTRAVSWTRGLVSEDAAIAVHPRRAGAAARLPEHTPDVRRRALVPQLRGSARDPRADLRARHQQAAHDGAGPAPRQLGRDHGCGRDIARQLRLCGGVRALHTA